VSAVARSRVSAEAARLAAVRRLRVFDPRPPGDFEKFAKEASELFEAPIGVVGFLYGRHYRIQAAVGMPVGEVPIDASFCGRTIADGRPVVVRDTLADAAYASNPMVVSGPKIRFYAGVPLSTRESVVIGSLCVMDARPREVSPEKLEGLLDLARRLMDVLEDRSVAVGAHPSRPTPGAGKALSRNALDDYRLLFESSPDPMWVYDLETLRFLAVNGAAARLYGYSREELLSISITDIRPPEEIPVLLEDIDKHPGGHAQLSPWRHRTRDGSDLLVEVVSDALIFEGRPARLVVAHDVTDRTRSEEALRESQQFNQEIISGAREGIVVYDRSLRYVVWNRFMEELTGLSAGEVFGKDALALFPHLREQGIDELLARALAGETVSSPEVFYDIPRTGKTGWVSSTYGPHRNARGEIVGVVGIVRDVSDRHAAVEALRDSEAKWRSLVEYAPNIILRVDREGRILYINRTQPGIELEAVLGASSLDFIRPEYHNLVRDAYRRVWETGEPADYEVAGLGPHGTTAWYRTSVGPIFQQGEVVGLTVISEDVTERKLVEKRVEYDSQHDLLTSLPNRTLFRDRLSQALAAAPRRGVGPAVLFVDLDYFKRVNDTLGHSAGDRLLQSVATRFNRCLRRQDTVARLGGDEFTLLIQDVARPEDAVRVAEQVLTAMMEPFVLFDRQFLVTASVGISVYPQHGADAETLLKNADIAMYRAKDLGRNNYQLFSAEMDLQIQERSILEEEMRHAVEGHEFLLHYQPIVRIADHRIIGLEALIRWSHPTRGLLPPTDFIPFAEDTRLIAPMGDWVLRTACRDARRLAANGGPAPWVAVNVSGLQFQHSDLVENVRRALAEEGVQGARLQVEITESVAMQNVERTVGVLGSLREMGVRVSIDDFGVGNSSLVWLRSFPVETIKIDRIFVADIGVTDSGNALVAAIIEMAHNLGMKVTAEGVEREDQLMFLRERGCDTFQGYLESPPLPFDKAAALLFSR
jgi:diguanylate cyclase (GGDEF)-like protein/PAS domain S-box-containing protein